MEVFGLTCPIAKALVVVAKPHLPSKVYKQF
jgi:hypothetical protein